VNVGSPARDYYLQGRRPNFFVNQTSSSDINVPNNDNFPFFIFYGDSDLEDADGTLARLTPVTGLATIEGLDQDSIVLEDQVNSVVSALNSWFETSVQGTFDDSTCADLEKVLLSPRDTLSSGAKSIPNEVTN
jgi:hypothetical protein